MIYFVVALVGLTTVQAAFASRDLSGQALVDYINANATTWHAELNTRFQIKNRLMNIKYIKSPVTDGGEEAPEIPHNDNIPVTFDARTKWPECSSISRIGDQSDCGACWAFASTEVITDRICIGNGGIWDSQISAVDLLSCCGSTCGDGCEGGYPIQAFKYWVQHGISTGSYFGENLGCKPYPFPPCGQHNHTYFHRCPDTMFPTPTCKRSCRSGYGISYNDDKHYGRSAYRVPSRVSAIQVEIMTHGPVEAAFTVYADFPHYKGGVYHHIAGKWLGGHAVKLIGWGVDNGTPYWLVANSWDTDWGENGYFKIRRGFDECGIESEIVAGLPQIKGM